MPLYTRPGVYVEETLLPVAQAPVDPGVATAAFVGPASRGPVGPTVVNSWREYVGAFGGFDGGDLAYALWLYFNNGGRSAYVSRAVADNAVAATVTVQNITTPTATNCFTATATSVGAWGNTVYISVVAPTIVDASRPGRFDLVVKLGGTADSNIVERFTDLSVDPADSRNLATIVNSSVSGSKFITVSIATIASYDATKNPPAVQTDTALTSGSDGTSPNLQTAINALATVEDVLILNIPATCDATTIGYALTLAQNEGNIFVVVDSPTPTAGETSAAAVTAITAILPGGASALPVSSLLAVYGPWVTIPDPATSAPGATVTLAPGGAVVGKFVAADTTVGPQQPAAGTGFPLSGVLSTVQTFTSTQQDTLFGLGFNLIKAIPGAGYCIWGQRTLASAQTDRSVAVRRSLITIKAELVNRTLFAVFEPNNDDLWGLIRSVLDQYLMTALQSGLLKGSLPSEAYYIICDSTNNTADTVNAGEVHIEVGVALQTPAEFVVINIGQFSGGTVVQEEVA